MNRAIPIAAISFALASSCGLSQAQQSKPAAPAPVNAEAARAEAAFAAWDIDHNGSLSQQEFRNGWLQVRRTSQLKAQIRRQFMAVDGNKNGAIDPSEYSTLILIKNAGKSAPPLSTFDANNDAKLQLGEYLTLVQRLAPREAAAGKQQ